MEITNDDKSKPMETDVVDTCEVDSPVHTMGDFPSQDEAMQFHVGSTRDRSKKQNIKGKFVMPYPF